VRYDHSIGGIASELPGVNLDLIQQVFSGTSGRGVRLSADWSASGGLAGMIIDAALHHASLSASRW
jgi:hypothetical protein